MSGYSFYFQDDSADQIILLKSIKTGIEAVSDTSSNIDTSMTSLNTKTDSVLTGITSLNTKTDNVLTGITSLNTKTDNLNTGMTSLNTKTDTVIDKLTTLANKTPSRIIQSKMLVLDSMRDANTDNWNPTFTLPSAITCANDEYMTMTVLRFNAMHDWADIPENSQISFQKQGQTAFTLTLGTFGKPPFNNIAVAVKNAWVLAEQGSGFTMDYNQNLGAYVIGYTSGFTMTVLTEDLARYMNVPYNTPIQSVANKITTGVLRAQKTVNLALCVSGVSAETSSVFRNLNKQVLCQMPVLSGSYIFFNYRSYVENEQAMKITDKSISNLTLEFLDCATGQQVPLEESCLTLEVNVYKI